MTTSKAVTDGNGKFLSTRLSGTGALTWESPAVAACFPNEAQAQAAAARFGGSVVNAPVWDAASSSYVVPA